MFEKSKVKVSESPPGLSIIGGKIKAMIEKILQEEGKDFSEETVKELALYRYGSQDKEHASAIEALYADDHYSLRQAVLKVIAVYSDHSRADIGRVPMLLAWMADHLEGVGWASADDYYGPASWSPAHPELGLSELHTELMTYDESATMIDRHWASAGNREYLTRMGAVPGEEPHHLHGCHITDHQTYNLAKSGWFREQADEVRQKLEAHEMTPSDALRTLIEYWEYYSDPYFRRINHRIEYIVRCAAEFPDTPELRKEFRRIVCSLSQPAAKKEDRI